MAKVEIDQSALRRSVLVDASQHLEEVGKDILRLCQEECPVQTGRLLASHRLTKISEERYIISANTPYARHVFDGTAGRRRNPWMLRAIDRARM